jgi:glutathione S-transferase
MDVAGNRIVLVETGAICEYLIDKAGGKLGPPARSDDIRLYRQFLHYAEGSVMPVLFALLVVSTV